LSSARLQPSDRRSPKGSRYTIGSSRYVIASLLALTVLGCTTAAEQRLLTQFFAASRLRDLTALSNISTVVFEPTVDGVVTSFDITGVSGDNASKDVSIAAPVRLPDGRTVSKQFAVSIRGGLITAISERPASPSTPRP
jgi:hypothetical protein